MNSEFALPRILIVEDDKLTREFVLEVIESFGYPAIAAADGLQAMRAIAETPSLELVFTDIAMPGFGGIVLADMVKQHRPRLKILYTTGGDVVEQAKQGAGILHGDILPKPYSPDQLHDEIARLLE